MKKKSALEKFNKSKRQIELLSNINIEDPSQLIKYRQHITVPAVWVPIQGIRSANLSDIPVGKITGLDQYILSFISDTGTPGGSTNKIIIASNIIDFKITSDVNVFTVPEGHIFNIDSMEILTTEITNPNEAPFVRFGTDLNPSLFYGPSQTMSNDLGYRHIIESPQNAAIENTTMTFGITSESLAESHFGFGIISGYLIKLV